MPTALTATPMSARNRFANCAKSSASGANSFGAEFGGLLPAGGTGETVAVWVGAGVASGADERLRKCWPITTPVATMTALNNSRAKTSRGRTGIPAIVTAGFLDRRVRDAVCCDGVRLACGRFRTEVSDDALRDCRGVFRSPVGAFHLSSLAGVLHVAELDKYRRVLGQIEAGEVGAAV